LVGLHTIVVSLDPGFFWAPRFNAVLP
jgi:hypothetical protein